MARKRAEKVQPPMAQPPLRWQELEWISRNEDTLRQYQGQWLAIEGSSIISHSADMVEAAREARAKGIATPFLYRVPSEGDLPFIG